MNISSLTDAELDRMIAEKRGFHRIDYRNNDGTISPDAVPHYSTDPRYAMELLKEMAEGHCFGGLVINIDKWGVDYKSGHNTYKRVNADTPERAIAEAWMEWAK